MIENEGRTVELHLPGEISDPGVYRDIGTGREIALTASGPLPDTTQGASCYVRLQPRATPLPVSVPPETRTCTGQCEACQRRRQQAAAESTGFSSQ